MNSSNGSPVNEVFRKLAAKTSNVVGSPWSFLFALLIVLVWLITGPAFNYSDTWQLVINTATTIVTFLMVFLIQNTQNRDARAIHLKLDELIRGVEGARTGLVDLEQMADEELDELQQEFANLRERYTGTQEMITQGDENGKGQKQGGSISYSYPLISPDEQNVSISGPKRFWGTEGEEIGPQS